MRSKPQQRTTEEDGGMGDWDTTTQHRSIIAVSFTVRNPNFFVCSLWQHPVHCPFIRPLTVLHHPYDVFNGAIGNLSSRTSHQLLDCDVNCAFPPNMCLDRMRCTFTGGIFFTSGTSCANPASSGASHGGPSKQIAIVFSGEAFTGSPHASRSPTSPKNCTHPMPNTEVEKRKKDSSNCSRYSMGTTLTHELHHHHTFKNDPFKANC